MIKLNPNEFSNYLYLQEKSKATIEKYVRDVKRFINLFGNYITSKEQLIAFKCTLQAKGYAVSSINSMLASINSYLKWKGKDDWKIKFIKQQKTFVNSKQQLSEKDYYKLLKTAQKLGKHRLQLLMETIAATGIRISELQGITVTVLKNGYGQIFNKGKLRQIFLPKELCKRLLLYCKHKNIKKGSVFITKSGAPLNRSNLWRMLKSLGKAAGIPPSKVYPHNFRHLFARVYYKHYKDIVSLADILGHSNINTTRIYTTENESKQKRRLTDLYNFIQIDSLKQFQIKRTT